MQSVFMEQIRTWLHYVNKTKQLETHTINWLGDKM